MTKLKSILLILIIGVQTINAANILAVLEIVPKDNVNEISVDELRHLTDELRRQATLALPYKSYTVLTRDNIIALIPSDEKEAECLAQSCAVDIGRVIGAEYVTQGGIGKFDKEYSLSIELYETMSGKLLGSIVMESAEIKDFLTAIRNQSPDLFGKMPDALTLKPKASKWIAISLDVAGAAALGFGIYQHSQKEKFYNEYKGNFEDKTYTKANDARKMRDIGFIAGGVLLGSGIAVHIFF